MDHVVKHDAKYALSLFFSINLVQILLQFHKYSSSISDCSSDAEPEMESCEYLNVIVYEQISKAIQACFVLVFIFVMLVCGCTAAIYDFRLLELILI
mmetsp:Transcript_637/g.767  ORF Transcript_637/g.767 Transcript_637/m.767 type:complete len:97 (-) Transcript_637:173-463(-)